jgi:SAM-dependent methyltransferase
MCSGNVLEFVRQSVSAEDIAGKRVIEVGAYDVNGSPRAYVESLGPSEYVGVDIEDGPGVDAICDAEDLITMFGSDSFDVLVTTEMMEHVRDWRKVITNLKGVVRPGGLIVLTTRSQGFGMHGFPYDFWRYETTDMDAIFAEFHPLDVQVDSNAPGVFVRAVKPLDFDETDLSGIELYNIIRKRRSLRVSDAEFNTVRYAWTAFRVVREHLPKSASDRLVKTVRQLTGSGR